MLMSARDIALKGVCTRDQFLHVCDQLPRDQFLQEQFCMMSTLWTSTFI